jgi:hypothetical protein
MTGLIKYSLPLLSAWAIYSIFFFSYANGFIELLQQTIANGILPGTKNQPLKTSFTSIAAVDRMLTSVTPFFWPLIDGSNPGASLYTFAIGGSIASTWILVYLESVRNGNSFRLISL